MISEEIVNMSRALCEMVREQMDETDDAFVLTVLSGDDPSIQCVYGTITNTGAAYIASILRWIEALPEVLRRMTLKSVVQTLYKMMDEQYEQEAENG